MKNSKQHIEKIITTFIESGKTHRLIARLSGSQNKSAAISVLLQPNSLKFDQNI